MLSKSMSLLCLPLVQVILSTHSTKVTFHKLITHLLKKRSDLLLSKDKNLNSLAPQLAPSLTSAIPCSWALQLRSLSWHRITGLVSYQLPPPSTMAGTSTAAVSPRPGMCVLALLFQVPCQRPVIGHQHPFWKSVLLCLRG